MRTLILSAILPLLLLGGCSTMQGVADDHDLHHPKVTPAMQDGAALAPTTEKMGSSGMMGKDGMASNADMMKNCPMMKADEKAPDGKMSDGMKGGSAGMMKGCPPSDQVMANCPMMKDGAMMKGDKAGTSMSGGSTSAMSGSGMSGKGQVMGAGDGKMNCPMMDDKPKAPAPH